MLSGLKRFVRSGLRAIPFRRRLVALGAILPPALKGHLVMRALYALTSTVSETDLPEIVTNMGIASHLRVALPRRSPPVYLFATPHDYIEERGALSLCDCLHRRCDGFLDVGAHRGYFVFYLRQAATGGVPIYYFEPHDGLFAALEANVRRNRLEQVTGLKAAIGRESGTATFYRNISDELSSSLTDLFGAKHQLEETTVEVLSFSDVARTHRLQRLCVKVDVEGAEDEFLEGARAESGRIEYLVMEVLGPAIEAGFVNRLRDAFSMQAYYINDFRLEYSPDGSYRYVHPQFNWLFCRESPSELERTLANSRLVVVK